MNFLDPKEMATALEVIFTLGKRDEELSAGSLHALLVAFCDALSRVQRPHPTRESLQLGQAPPPLVVLDDAIACACMLMRAMDETS